MQIALGKNCIGNLELFIINNIYQRMLANDLNITRIFMTHKVSSIVGGLMIELSYFLLRGPKTYVGLQSIDTEYAILV